jgi:hypothetical protein
MKKLLLLMLVGTSLRAQSVDTIRELTIMNDANFSEVKFNQSTIGASTKKALEDASAKILTRMVKKGIFKKIRGTI